MEVCCENVEQGENVVLFLKCVRVALSGLMASVVVASVVVVVFGVVVVVVVEVVVAVVVEVVVVVVVIFSKESMSMIYCQ